MPSIEQRKLWSVSPSAIDAYDKCPRSWYYSYVLGQRGPTPPHMAKGTSIHAAIEHYHKTGEVLIEHENNDAPGVKWPVMEFVQAAIPHIAKPILDSYWGNWRIKGDGGLMLEQAGEIGTWNEPEGTPGPTMRQYIDCVEAYPDRAIITDYKTCSSYRYCKTPEELAHNTQLLCNARWLFLESDYKEVTLRHLYLLTKGKRPKANPVSVVVTREHVFEQWEKVIIPKIREMAHWAKLAPENADPLPPNTDHCSAYGGCSFKPNCYGDTNDLVSIRRTTMKEGEKMSLLKNMMAQAGAMVKPAAPVAEVKTEPKAEPKAEVTTGRTQSVVPNVANAPKPASAAPPAPSKPNLLSLLSKKATPPAEPALTPEKAQVAAVAAGYPVTPPAGYDPNGVLPPDAPSRISTPEEVAAANPVKEEEKVEAEEAPETAGEKPKRKRRTKAEMEAAREATDVTKPAEIAEAVAEPKAEFVVLENFGTTVGRRFAFGTQEQAAPEPDVAPEDADKEPPVDDELEKVRVMLSTPDSAFGCGTQTLFIDCLPGKGWPGEQPKDALDYMHAFNTLASASAKVTDYRLIRYESKGYLATAIKVYMKGLPSCLYVDSRMPGADILLETLTPYCKMVFRGVR